MVSYTSFSFGHCKSARAHNHQHQLCSASQDKLLGSFWSWAASLIGKILQYFHVRFILFGVIPSYLHKTIDLLLYLVVVGLPLPPDHGDGHPTALPAHHHWLLQEGHSVQQTVLDVDVGGVPSLQIHNLKYQIPISDTNIGWQFLDDKWHSDIYWIFRYALKYWNSPGDATRHAAAAEAGLGLEGRISSRPGWDTDDCLQQEISNKEMLASPPSSSLTIRLTEVPENEAS